MEKGMASPTAPRCAYPQWVQHRRENVNEGKQTHYVPQGAPRNPWCQ
jgi:hypothetical protein